MFDSLVMAQQYFEAHFEPPRIEMLMKAVGPAIAFRPTGDARLGGTRIGGTPDLPPEIEWPLTVAPDNPQEVAIRANEDSAKEMLKYFGMALPYTFLAQIDLAEAARLEPAAALLPSQGRLLFFYDLMSGPWDTGTRTTRVVWDQSPLDALKPQAVPPALAAEDERFRQAMGEISAKDTLDPSSPEAGSPFLGPSRSMQLRVTLKPPHTEAIELESHPALAKAVRDTKLEDEEELHSRYSEMFWSQLDPHYSQENSLNWQQLLGSPVPVQSDPRYYAVLVSAYGVQHLPQEEWDAKRAEIDRQVREWRLLLQIDLSDFEQRSTEGTIYFVIREADLKERRFDRVVGVYQQT